MKQNGIVLMGVGDVGPIHEPLDAYSEFVRPVLAEADLRFAQCERVYSERGAFQVHSAGAHSRVKPHMASIFNDCKFDVLSVASNHAMDWGEEALLDSIANLQARGIKTTGAGKNLEEARRPAIVECKGTKVGFLAYCSVLNEGYAATAHKPGVAPLRAHTYYQPIEYQAGVPPRVVTIPYEEDLSGMVSDIAALKKQVDIVVVSVHWGIHFIPRLIADYQTIAAKAAFNAGADVIFGHHAHVPKAIGVHDGKVCFYSLSNFMMSASSKTPEQRLAFEKRYGVAMDTEYPNLPYGADGKRTMIARVVVAKSGIGEVAFLPALIDRKLRPEVLRNGDPRFADALSYMEWASADFPHRFDVQGDRVLVHPC